MRLIKLLAVGAALLLAIPGAYAGDDRAIGRMVAVEALTLVGPRVGDVKTNLYVNLVGRAVASFSDTPRLEWRFAVINSQEASSFSTPGGYVFITIGLLSRLKSEAQLAGILAHEIAHVAQRHIAVTLEGKAGKFKPVETALSLLFTEGLEKGKELEADLLGMKYAALAGYDPNGLHDALVNIKEIEGKGKSVFFITHPLVGQRLATLEKGAKHYPKKGKTLQERFVAAVN